VDAAGHKLRLRSRTYATRNEAGAALKKFEAAGFSGIVASKS
jgi:DedD protein